MVNPCVRMEGDKVVEATADGDFTTAEIVRAFFSAFVSWHERRSESAKRAAKTAARRRELRVYKAAEALKNNRLTPSPNCRICGRALADRESIDRGIGSECWGRVLAALECMRAAEGAK